MEAAKPHREEHVLVLGGQPAHAGRPPGRFGDQGSRQYGLRSQVRRDPAGGTGGSQALPHPDDVSGADVLGYGWRLRRRRYARWRWQHWLGLFLLALIIGCEFEFRPEPLYSKAREELTQGFFDGALQEADRGLRQTERRDPLWSSKFRLLKAEAYLRKGNLQQAVELLAQPPPPQSPADLTVRRRIIQGEALCRLNRPQESETALREAELLIPGSKRGLQAELALTRGRCALLGDRKIALQYFARAAE